MRHGCKPIHRFNASTAWHFRCSVLPENGDAAPNLCSRIVTSNNRTPKTNDWTFAVIFWLAKRKSGRQGGLEAFAVTIHLKALIL
jgi:hypothetical protein